MFTLAREGAFGEHCTVFVKHTFIDIQCSEEENVHVMRRQKSDPLFAHVGAREYPTLSNCRPPLEKLLVQEPLTPTTCDECLTPASLNDDSLTPTSCGECDDDCDQDEVNLQVKSFSFADAVDFLDADDNAVQGHGKDTSVVNSWETVGLWELDEMKTAYGLPQMPEAPGTWQCSMGWTEVCNAAPVLSTRQQVFPGEYDWTGDASSRIPMMSNGLMQDQGGNRMDLHLEDTSEALTVPTSPSHEIHGNYYTTLSEDVIGTAQFSNTGLQNQHCTYYVHSEQMLDTTASLLPQPPPPPLPPQTQPSNYYAAQTEEAAEATTTLMVRNLPTDLFQPALVDKFKDGGYAGLFDFVYMPMNFRGHGNFGYAFVNFISYEIALQFMHYARTVEHGPAEDPQRWDAVWSTCQGLSANIERYRNSPLMHELVPTECKPALYDENACQVLFPVPTKNIPKPRIHWPGPKDAKLVKDRAPRLEALVQGSSLETCVDLAPERRPGRSKNHQRQQVATQRRK